MEKKYKGKVIYVILNMDNMNLEHELNEFGVEWMLGSEAQKALKNIDQNNDFSGMC